MSVQLMEAWACLEGRVLKSSCYLRWLRKKITASQTSVSSLIPLYTSKEICLC